MERSFARGLAAAVLLVLALSPLVVRAQGKPDTPPAARPPLVSPAISVGDTVNILVVGEPALTGERRVDLDGTVSLPLAGQVKVEGLTAPQAAAVIARVLRQKRLLRSPDVTVTITGMERPREFTVAGAVNAAGPFPLQTRTTLLQAIARARGPQDGARQNAVEVTRIQAGGRTEKRTYDVTKAENATVEIEPGDYIFVPFPRRRPEVNILTVLGSVGTVLYFLGRR